MTFLFRNEHCYLILDNSFVSSPIVKIKGYILSKEGSSLLGFVTRYMYNNKKKRTFGAEPAGLCSVVRPSLRSHGVVTLCRCVVVKCWRWAAPPRCSPPSYRRTWSNIGLGSPQQRGLTYPSVRSPSSTYRTLALSSPRCCGLPYRGDRPFRQHAPLPRRAPLPHHAPSRPVPTCVLLACSRPHARLRPCASSHPCARSRTLVPLCRCGSLASLRLLVSSCPPSLLSWTPHVTSASFDTLALGSLHLGVVRHVGFGFPSPLRLLTLWLGFPRLRVFRHFGLGSLASASFDTLALGPFAPAIGG